MTARDKLWEAEFFLNKLHAPFKNAKPGHLVLLIKNAEKGWNAYLSAFLSAMRSILDHLLEDYNIKHSLDIPLTEKLYPRTFKRRAKELKDEAALNFLKWWKMKMREINKDPTCSFLFNLRHISTHRRQVRPGIAKVTLFASKEGEKSKPARGAIVHGWFFRDHDEEDILTMCNKYFAAMKEIVDEANRKYL